MIFGYARISTTKETQITDRQILALKKYAEENRFYFDEIIEERVSGSTKAENRKEYAKLKYKLRKDDVLVVTDLDRLGRDADNVIAELKELKALGVRAVILDMPYLCDWNSSQNDSMYNMVVDILITLKAHMAQQEREKTVQRINQGLDAAKAKGKVLGRPKAKLPKEFVKEYKKFTDGVYGDMTATSFARMLGIGRSTLYKYISIYKDD